MTLTLTVHRGTQQIGGSCIELASFNGERLILDAGRPLDAPREATGLLPETLDIAAIYHPSNIADNTDLAVASEERVAQSWIAQTFA